MKAITLHAPWGSLITLGVKTWETRSWPCPPSIVGQRVIFHQAKKRPPSWLRVGDYRVRGFGRTGLALEGPGLPPFRSVPRLEGEILPRGRVVGSGVITESLPIIAVDQDPHTAGVPIPPDGYVPHVAPTARGALWWWKGRSETENASTGRPTWMIEDITDQLPYGDWTPGRYAWRIEDAAPTTERCPWCWGRGDTDPYMHSTCPVCDGAGHCDPYPATGQQGWWNWTPTNPTP